MVTASEKKQEYMKKKEDGSLPHRFLFVCLLSLMLFIPGFLAAGKNVQAAVIDPGQQKGLIWFGDSRTVQLAKAVYGYKPKKGVWPKTVLRKHVVARSSSRLGWAKGTGYRNLCKRLKNSPNQTVIFNFGVNDIGRGNNHKSGYVALIRKLHKKYPKVTICFMSVNPVKAASRNPYARSKSRAKTVNRRIAEFNSYVRKRLPKGSIYINTNKNVRFTYKDGLHYTKYTYRRISDYITGKRTLK